MSHERVLVCTTNDCPELYDLADRLEGQYSSESVNDRVLTLFVFASSSLGEQFMKAVKWYEGVESVA